MLTLLVAKNPGSKVKVQQMLRTADGKKALDPKTGKGRVVDQVVIENGMTKTYEATSLSASYVEQHRRESRILDSGGTYIRDRETRELVPVRGLSELKRLP